MDALNVWRAAPVWVLTVGTWANFVAMYLVFAGTITAATERWLPALGIGRVVDARPRPAGQRRREARLALLAMATFSLWTPVIVGLERAGTIRLRPGLDPGAVLPELVVLLLWNEAHFWLSHRLLHVPWLYRHVHALHHRSTVPSPFSTYALHPVEAFLLGSVMVPVLLVMDLHLATLMIFPAVSLGLNSLGHANYAVMGLGSGCAVAHGTHHKRGRGAYGFLLSGAARTLRSLRSGR